MGYTTNLELCKRPQLLFKYYNRCGKRRGMHWYAYFYNRACKLIKLQQENEDPGQRKWTLVLVLLECLWTKESKQKRLSLASHGNFS